MPCQTAYRDDSQQVLLFKIASCLAEGGAVAGVASFNGRTGIVTLTAADVSTALGCTPLCEPDGDARYVLKSGDSMTGALSIDNGSQVASAPYLSLSQTWNNAATTFTGLQSNVTNTASASDSNLFNFQTDGIDRFRYAAVGQLFATRQDATNSGVTFFQRKRGNAGGATNAVAADATIGTITHSGWDGTAYANGSRISGLANQTWTNVAHGSRIDLYTTPDGSTSEQITLRLAATGQALFTDGTAALPALSFQTDLDTGIYRIGANSLGLSTGGAFILSAIPGSVGVGTLSPIDRLTVEVATNKRISVGEATASAISDFVTGGTVIQFSRPGDGSNNYAGLFQFDSAVSNNFALAVRGDLVFATGGGATYTSALERLRITTSGTVKFATGVPIAITSGANQRAGNAVLVAGTVTVANTSVTANTVIMLTRKTSGGTLGTAITYTVTAATSFTITSDSALDTSTFSYLLIEVP